LSRFRIFTLLATAVALAGMFAACGGGSDSSDEDPQTVIEDASLEGVESGTIDLTLGVDSEGDEGGELDLSLSGPFQSRGAESLPELGFDVTAKGDIDGESIDFDGGLTLLSDRAFIGFDGTVYEVDPTTFGFVKSGFEQGLAEGGEGGSSSPTECQEAVAGIDLTTVVDNLENEGSVDVDGTTTTKVSGDVDPEGAIDAIIALTDDPACSAQFEAAGPLPLDELEAAKGELSDAVKKAHAEIYVGDDGIIRKVVAELSIEPKDAAGEKVEIDFELTLAGVNEKQEIAAPADAEPLEGLFQQLNIDPQELLESAGDGGGLGDLLEGIGDDSSGGAGEIEIPEDLPGSEAAVEYADCLGEAKSASDLQKCTRLLE
jgi:hypothetical protein